MEQQNKDYVILDDIFSRFKPRPYQYKLCKSFEKQEFKKYLVIWPRRAGKDICALGLLLRAALLKVGTYFYVFPTFQMGRRCLWDAIDISGRRILNYYIPDEFVSSRNEQQMRIRLNNGSQIQILGSDDYDTALVGTNAIGMVFSEYALSNPMAYSYSLPILNASGGWALFVSTPRGKNALWDLYTIASKSKNWFCEKLDLDDTKHIPVEDIENDIAENRMSRDLAMQEYWTSFELGVEGSFYARYIDSLRLKEQITNLPWDPGIPTHTACDLGYNDDTTFIFFQLPKDGSVRIIDSYSNNKKGLEHYAKILKEKPYSYGKHLAPFDVAVHDLGTGISRLKMMKDLGIQWVVYADKQPSINDGIEAVRRNLPKVWFDEKKCAPLIKALENYRQEYDEKKKVYKGDALHDWSSHFADAMRYLCVGLPKCAPATSAEELEKRYVDAMYGNQNNMPGIFGNQGRRF